MRAGVFSIIGSSLEVQQLFPQFTLVGRKPHNIMQGYPAYRLILGAILGVELIQ